MFGHALRNKSNLAQDEEQAAQLMAEKLAKRKVELSRRNQVLQRRR